MVASRPRTTTDSNSGGPTARPVSATRTGACAFASCGPPSALTNPAAKAARSMPAFSESASQALVVHSSMVSSSMPRRPVVLGDLLPRRLVDDGLVEPQEVDHRLDLAERPDARLDLGPEHPDHGRGAVVVLEVELGARHELLDGQRPDVLAVDGLELLDVEEGRRRR